MNSCPASFKHTKQLFNALDNDGTLLGWLTTHGLANPPPPPFELPDGTVFDLTAYIGSRADLTAEFKELMPGLNGFVTDWLRVHGDARVPTSERTAKSYFLQEAEGPSRWAKVQWAKLRGDAHVTNLQHDGVVIGLPHGVEPGVALTEMSAACQEVLGYEQPVGEKPIGEEVGDSEDGLSEGED